MQVELRAPRDLIGFARYEGYLRLFYGETWPYGALDQRLRGLDGDAERIQFALALLAHGRPARARTLLAGMTDAPSGLAPELAAARALLAPGSAPPASLEPLTLGVPVTAELGHALRELTALIQAAYASGEHARAMALFERLPAAVRVTSGPGLRVLYGLVGAQVAGGDKRKLKSAAAEIETVIRRDPSYVALHPELYAQLAHVQYAGQAFDRAVRNMLAYARLAERKPADSVP
jgi:hypothetical protein